MICHNNGLIYVFDGYGVDGRSLTDSLKRVTQKDPGIEIRIITAAELKRMDRIDPDRVIAFFLPGGAKPQYDVQIGERCFALIRDYVEKGGSFYGICAGAYYASKEFEYRPGTPGYRRKKPGLEFFNGLARGPDPSLASQYSQELGTWYDATIVDLSIEPDIDNPKSSAGLSAKSLYWNGPVFTLDPDADRPETLASINLNGSPTPMIMRIPHGRGQAFLSSLHPEVSAAQLHQHISTYLPHGSYIARLSNVLETGDRQREVFWTRFVNRSISHFQTRHALYQKPALGA